MDTNSNNLRARRKAVALVLVVFVLGIALGALGAYVAGRRVWGAPTEGASHRGKRARSEEHTSELQSPCNLVCRLLLEKKKQTQSNLLHRQHKVARESPHA